MKKIIITLAIILAISSMCYARAGNSSNFKEGKNISKTTPNAENQPRKGSKIDFKGNPSKNNSKGFVEPETRNIVFGKPVDNPITTITENRSNDEVAVMLYGAFAFIILFLIGLGYLIFVSEKGDKGRS